MNLILQRRKDLPALLAMAKRLVCLLVRRPNKLLSAMKDASTRPNEHASTQPSRAGDGERSRMPEPLSSIPIARTNLRVWVNRAVE